LPETTFIHQKYFLKNETMKTKLFYSFGRQLDDGFKELSTSLGEALLKECKTREQNAIVMSNYEGGEVFIKLGDIKKCFAVNVIGMLCFVLKKNRVSINGKFCQALTFVASPRDNIGNILGRESKEEFETMVDFVSKNFNGLQPQSMNSIEDKNVHIHGSKFQNSQVVMDLKGAMEKLRTRNEEPLSIFQTALKMKNIRLYHSYMHYLHQNSLSARDLKTFIRRSENLPKLFEEEFPCESPGMLWFIVVAFIFENDYCQNVSYLKCSECGYAYSRSKRCQIENWPLHKNFCKAKMNIEMDFGWSRAVINSHIMKEVDKIKIQDTPLTFKVFRKEIERHCSQLIMVLLRRQIILMIFLMISLARIKLYGLKNFMFFKRRDTNNSIQVRNNLSFS